MGSGTLNWMKRANIYAPAMSYLCETALWMLFEIKFNSEVFQIKKKIPETFYDLGKTTIDFDYLSTVNIMLLKVTYYLGSQWMEWMRQKPNLIRSKLSSKNTIK